MELHQLRYLLAVVDEGSFTAAADAVRISQSGISTQIQKLERELGVTVLDRSSRRVSLTPAGQRVLPFVRSAVAATLDVAGAAEAIRGLVTGAVRIGTVTGLVWPPLFDALAAVHGEHPGIDLRLSEGNSEDLISRVRAGTLDVGVAAWAGEDPSGVRSRVIIDDRLVVVVGRDHPWAGASSVPAAALGEADVVAMPPGTGSRSALDDLMAREGLPASEPHWEVSTPYSVQMLTSRGLGVGVVSATTAEGWEDVVVVPLGDAAARSRLGLVWQRQPSHASRALLDRLLAGVDAGG